MKKFLGVLIALLFFCNLSSVVPVAHASLLTGGVAYYKLSDDTDATGNGNTLSVTSGTVTYDTGFIGNAADFGSVIQNANALSTTGDMGVDLSQAFTVNCWADDVTAITNNHTVNIWSWWSETGTAQSFFLYFQNSSNTHLITVTSNKENVTNIQTPYTPTPGVWAMYTFTQDASGNEVLYINGSSYATASQSTKGSDHQIFTLGNNNTAEDPLDIGFPGKIDECGTWSRALTSTEVTTLYNAGAGDQYPFGSTAPPPALQNWLESWWKI